MRYSEEFEVIVVGGGHAGTEAALVAARAGCRTLLLTHNLETLGQMSCNPSIGGIGKGHLVKEVDALGGAMALAADKAGIHFRVLNSSKGPAVRATRAQADRILYRQAVRGALEREPGLAIFQASVDDILIRSGRAAGVLTQQGIEFSGRSVVLTAGTFLAGLIHVGLLAHQGGRAGSGICDHGRAGFGRMEIMACQRAAQEVANGSNAVGKVSLKRCVGIAQMHVHVPQPGNHVLVSGINDVGVGRLCDLGSDADDSPVINGDVGVTLHLSGDDVNNRGVF